MKLPNLSTRSFHLIGIVFAVFCLSTSSGVGFSFCMHRLYLRGGSTEVTAPRHCEADLQRMKLNELQKLLREKNLSTKGLKAELVKRLAMSYDSDHQQEAHIEPIETENQPAKQAIENFSEDVSNKRGAGEFEHPTETANLASPKRFAGGSEEMSSAPIAAPALRVHIDRSSEPGFVKVYNNYPVKDKCRALGFKFDPAERVWILPLNVAVEILGVASPSEVSEAGILQKIQEAQIPENARLSSPPPLSVEFIDGNVRVAGGTYFFKDKLRFLKFRWDPVNICWVRPVNEVADRIKERDPTCDVSPNAVVALILDGKIEEEATAAAAAAAAAVSAGQAGDVSALPRPQPELRIVDDQVLIYNSYDLKDTLRGLGFRFATATRTWNLPLADAMSRLSVDSPSMVTLDAILGMKPVFTTPVVMESIGDTRLPGVVVEGDTVLVVNGTYTIKEQLRLLGFRWDPPRHAWAQPLQDVRARLVSAGVVASEEAAGTEVTLEVLMASATALSALPPGGGGRAAPRIEVVDGSVLVHNSYDIKDQLRALGFRWDSARVAWARALDEVLAVVGAEEASGLTIASLLDAAKAAGPAPADAAAERKPAYLTADDTEVLVFNSYDIRDRLRAHGFRWSGDRGAWTKSTDEVMQLLGVESPAAVTLEALLACPPAVDNGAGGGGGGGGGGGQARLELVNDEVLVYNSYSVKDQLRTLEFRFDSERRVWAKPMYEVKAMLKLEDQGDITLELLLAHHATLASADEAGGGGGGGGGGDDDGGEFGPGGGGVLPEGQTTLDFWATPSQAGRRAGGTQSGAASRGAAGGRSPSPAPADELPGDRLLSSMGHSVQGWSRG